ncbi:hypothetical protein [Kordiimonas sp.]|uniref:hypothetical protein n=1 Tax=Kordiimonas sp. TaxID=1970157 RepID=UPI003A94EE6E
MKNKLLHSRGTFILSLILFKVILDFAYVNFINVVYAASYHRFFIEVEIQNYVFCWLIYLSFMPVLRHRLLQVSDYFSSTAVLGLIGPLCTVAGLDASRSLYPVLVSAAAIMVIAVVCRKEQIRLIRIPHLPGVSSWALTASGFVVAFVAMWYVFSGAVANLNFDLSAVYEFRAVNSQITDVGFVAYLNIWAYKVFSIFLLTYAVWKKKKTAVVAIVVLQVFFFGVTAHKAVLFFPFLVFAIWYYFKRNNLAIALPVTFGLAVLIAYAGYALFDAQMLASMIIRRVFFVPAAATFSYFEFFSTTPYVYWADSVLSPFISYDYSMPLSYIIGDFMLNPEMGANNGFISRGYAHAGLFGVGIYVLMLCILLKFLDSLTQSGVPLWVSLCVTAIPIRTVIFSSDLFTSLVSHGFLWSVILLLAVRKDPERRPEAASWRGSGYANQARG